jgi:hypothetical protein
VAISDFVRVFVEIAIPCERSGPRVFEGVTVGFHPRSWEIVRPYAVLRNVYYFCIARKKIHPAKGKKNNYL